MIKIKEPYWRGGRMTNAQKKRKRAIRKINNRRRKQKHGLRKAR